MTSSALWRGFSLALVGEREIFSRREGLVTKEIECREKPGGSTIFNGREERFGIRFTRKKSPFCVYATSNSQTAELKATNAREASRSRSRRGDEDIQRQSKTRVSSKTLAEAAGQKKVVKDGFAGLSSLKTQLEQERPRISKVNVSEVNSAVNVQNQPHEGRIMEVAAQCHSMSTLEKGASVQGRNTSLNSTRDHAPRKLRKENVKSRRGREGNKNSGAREETSEQGFTWSKNSHQNRFPEAGATAERSSRFRYSSVGDGDTVKDQQSRIAETGTTISSNPFFNPSLESAPKTREFSDSAFDVDSAEYDSADDGKLTGRSVMEAFERAAASREGKSNTARRKGRPGSESDGDQKGFQKTESLQPFVFKPEWASQLQELEKDLESLRRVP